MFCSNKIFVYLKWILAEKLTLLDFLIRVVSSGSSDDFLCQPMCYHHEQKYKKNYSGLKFTFLSNSDILRILNLNKIYNMLQVIMLVYLKKNTEFLLILVVVVVELKVNSRLNFVYVLLTICFKH